MFLSFKGPSVFKKRTFNSTSIRQDLTEHERSVINTEKNRENKKLGESQPVKKRFIRRKWTEKSRLNTKSTG